MVAATADPYQADTLVCVQRFLLFWSALFRACFTASRGGVWLESLGQHIYDYSYADGNIFMLLVYVYLVCHG